MVTAMQIELGAKIVTADGKELGTVSEIASSAFKVDRRFSPDLWLGNEYVDNVAGGIVQMILTREGLGAAKVEPRN